MLYCSCKYLEIRAAHFLISFSTRLFKPELIIQNEIGKYLIVKEPSIDPPDIYLGGKVWKVVLDTGVKYWDFSLLQYVQEAVRSIRKCLEKR